MQGIKELFREKSQTVYVYLTKETVTDPYRNEVEHQLLPPIPIKAIIVPVPNEKLQWTLPGLSVDKAKILIVESKHLSLLKRSYKIKVQGEDYAGRRLNSSEMFNLTELDNYHVKLYVIQSETDI